MECFCRDRTGIREGSEISTKGLEDGSGVLNSILVPLPLQKLGSSFPLTWVGVHLVHILGGFINSNHLSLAGHPPAPGLQSPWYQM